ncbi:alpha/beta fold hydrolase [Pseudoduganella eburnea]|uniref:Alpha/beta fold hydrolase n=1 Tax=Massilia eburnea TaxID=1776165 RepID=A0A6L6QJH3_9BURK|nr:alpha/beta fold hydrolase [Massilia eburnea]MTW12260.1 alpha/beta fold hydrolase [Massilia eburnea]
MNRFSEDRFATFKGRHGAERKIHIWEPLEAPAGVLLAIHGGLAHAGDYVTPALYFKQHRFATVAFDLCGHENARRVDIPDFGIFIEEVELFQHWVKQHFPGMPVFIMGHSMGALIATRFGLERLERDPLVKGFVLSSPYYVNAIKVPAVLEKLSGVLATLLPTMKVPMASLTDLLTHDVAITARHHRDEADNVRASECTVRFGVALQGAQKGLASLMPTWRWPLYAVVAGDDKLADPKATLDLLAMVDPKLLECHVQHENYHENFNEVNREEIFADILRWMCAHLSNPVNQGLTQVSDPV